MTIPFGFCLCGCGRKTSIITETNRIHGRLKGMPNRFITGHNRSRLQTPVVVDARPFKICGVYCRLIPLTKGLYAIVDATDYERLMRRKWYAVWSRSAKTYYAARTDVVCGVKKTLLMHREIAAVAGFSVVDHRDHVGLNCTRLNLRPCSQGYNIANARLRKDNKIGIKGVQQRGTRYIARIRFNGITYRYGPCDSPQEAGRLYYLAARRFYGNFAFTESRNVQSKRGRSSAIKT